ncbi:MAG: formylglycine-rating enzyme family protein [Nevskia sp.]|nr:formylglycine-rating enzyme family protein [Nevskia sp.]
MKCSAVVGFVLLIAVGAAVWKLQAPTIDVTAQLPALGDRAKCAAYDGLPQAWGKNLHAGMQHVAGGSFEFGSERGYADERPLMPMRIASFWIDRTEVTNAEFARFVAATGYVTDAERGAGAVVFQPLDERSDAPASGHWWRLVAGANWRHPDGSASDIGGRAHEPVVDVTFADAGAYARWRGRRLPTEAEWELAAKAGRSNAVADQALRDARGKPSANFWQGLFPVQDRAEDGFAGRAPVGCYPANPYGLHDMVGNVWEWTADVYRARREVTAASADELRDIGAPHTNPDRRVIKGGSFLCADNYCVRARAASRQAQEADLPAAHIGFRTAL